MCWFPETPMHFWHHDQTFIQSLWNDRCFCSGSQWQKPLIHDWKYMIVSYHAYCTSLIRLTQFAVSTFMSIFMEMVLILKKYRSCLSLVVGIYLHLCKWGKNIASLICSQNRCKLWHEQQGATVQHFVLHSCKEGRMNIADCEAMLMPGKGSQIKIAFLPIHTLRCPL